MKKKTEKKTEKGIEKRLKNLKRFGIEKPVIQPSSEAKKKGWMQRIQRIKILEEIEKLLDMSYAEIKARKEDMKEYPENYTVRQVKLIDYILNNKYLKDLMDRYIPKAKQDIDINLSGEVEVDKKTKKEMMKDFKEGMKLLKSLKKDE